MKVLEKLKDDLYPSDSKPGVSYVLGRVMKRLNDGKPLFSLGIGTRTYNLDLLDHLVLIETLLHGTVVDYGLVFRTFVRTLKLLILFSIKIRSLQI